MISICSVLTGLLLFLVAVALYFISAVRKRSAYFKKRGIPYLVTRLGSTWKMLTGSADIVQVESQIYEDAKAKSKAPITGLFDVFGQTTPYYVISDLNVLKAVLVKDFDHFVNRRPFNTKGNKFFKKMLTLLQNEQWKETRMKLSPLFTTGKIRKTFQIFETSSQRMEMYLKLQMQYPARKTVDLDFLTLFSKYAVDVIANCAFGVDSKCWEVLPHDRSTFEKMSKQLGFQFGGALFMFKLMMTMVCPKLADYLGIEVFDTESQNYFAGVITQVITMRRNSGERREDFLQLMLDAQAGLLKADEETSHVMNGTTEEDQKGGLIVNENMGKVSLNDDDIIANEMMFLNAGFDTTQTVLLFAVYSLALEPIVQDKLYEEVTSVLEKHGDQMSYEALSEMVYMDMVLYESMRMYPPSTRTERACNKDYHVPGTNFVIEKGSVVLIPICGIHKDPEYYPHPEKFNPDRFSQENKALRHPYSYMPFGHGPRNCIGMRFAWVKVKLVMAQLVRSFQFAPCSKTQIPMIFDGNMVVKPKNGMWLNLSARE